MRVSFEHRSVGGQEARDQSGDCAEVTSGRHRHIRRVDRHSVRAGTTYFGWAASAEVTSSAPIVPRLVYHTIIDSLSTFNTVLCSIFDNVKCPRSKLSVLIIGLLACIIIVYQIGTVVKLLTRHAYEWMLFGYCSSNSVIVTVESFFRSLCSLSEWWAGVRHCGHNLYKRARDTGNVLFFLHIIRL